MNGARRPLSSIIMMGEGMLTEGTAKHGRTNLMGSPPSLHLSPFPTPPPSNHSPFPLPLFCPTLPSHSSHSSISGTIMSHRDPVPALDCAAASSFVHVLKAQGIVPGIKVDTWAVSPSAGSRRGDGRCAGPGRALGALGKR